MDNKIKDFLSSRAFGVAGASKDRNKYGNKVLRSYLQHGLQVYPIHPTETEIEGIDCVPRIENLPNDVQSISIITPPPITEKLVDQAIKKGIKHIWMQPGAESEIAVKKCEENNISVIYGGPCILIQLSQNNAF